MHKRAAKCLGVVLSLVLLLSVPGLVGCSDDTETRRVVTIGFLEDLTGPAGHAVSQTYAGAQDYFRKVEEAKLIPGVKIKLVSYDTRLDYSRIMPGYVWLKGQGVDMYWMLASIMVGMIATKFEQDKMLVFCSEAIPTTLNNDWIFHLSSGQNYKAVAMLEWIIENWDYKAKERPPKIGLMGVAGFEAGVLIAQTVSDMNAEYPDKFDLKTLFAPAGGTTWASEINQLKDSDYIFTTALYGPQAASFMKEARDRGYHRPIVGLIDNFLGFWDLITAAVSQEALDGLTGVSAYPIWTDDIPFIAQAKADLAKYQPAKVDWHMARTGWLSGQSYAMVLAAAVQAAAEEVGPENIDGATLRNAMAGLSLTVEGWGTEAWQYSNDLSILQKDLRLYQYDASKKNWYSITDWEKPSALR